MKTEFALTALVAVVLFAAPRCSLGAEEESVDIGTQVGELAFKDIRYLERSLADFEEKKAFVIVCMNTTCPLVQRYIPKLKRLEKTYRDDVQFIGLNVNRNDSIRAMAAQAVEFDVEFPCVQDVDGKTVRTLGVSRTPEVVVLDADRRLRYRGRIDDQYRLGGSRPKVTAENLKDAIDSVLQGKPPKVAETPVDGCLISLTPPKASDGSETFIGDVEPLIRKHCVECHRPGTEAPFSLVSYEDVRRQAATIAEVVADQRMPPWYGDDEHRDFANLRGLNARERELIVRWVANGMLRGESEPDAAPPKPVDAGEKWEIGEPDLVIKMDQVHTLPAEGYIPYRYISLPYVFPGDTWVEAIQLLPDNPRVVHHCNVFAVGTGKDGNQTKFLTGKVPGVKPFNMGDGIALLIPAESRLQLQIHYTSTGKDEKCRISVGLRYHRGRVQKEFRQVAANNREFSIPAHAGHHRVTATANLDRNADGLGLYAHMHLRGKDMTFLARFPDGKTEQLLVVPNYNFDWQISYFWTPDRHRFPKGTILECIAHFDNSAFNPYNPDPKATVKHGPQTYHEMMYGFMFYTDSDEQLNLSIDPKTGLELKDTSPQP